MLKTSQIIFVIFLFSMLFGQPIAAVEVDDLYQGKVLVGDRTQKSRMSAHKRAISQVFEKVTGSSDVLDLKKIQTVVNYRSANYITSFRYITDEHDRTFLVDEFDQRKIDALLKSVGASIWGKRRPNTLIWLVREEGISRNIVEGEFAPQLTEFIIQSSDDKGLPLLLPKMDIVDKNAIFSSDIWGRFYNIVREASKRYQVDNVLVARMRYVENDQEPEYQTGWLLDYELINESSRLISGQQNGNQFDVIRNMITDMGQHFAAQYAVKSEEIGSDELTLVLQNYGSAVGLVKAENLLKSVSAIDHVQLVSMTHDEVEFKLSLSGESLDVTQALKLLDEFKFVTTPVIEEPVRKPVSVTIEEQLSQLDNSTNVVASLLGKVESDSEMNQINRVFYQWQGK